MTSTRSGDVILGVRIEVISIVWMVIEMGVSIGAGLAAHSALLTAFGIDSLIELVSAGILLWRLEVESRGASPERVEQAERRAAWIVAISLALLCVYVLASAVYGLAARAEAARTVPGIAIAALAVAIMPALAYFKRRIAGRIHSEALWGDAANSITCAAMAGTVLVGLALDGLAGWWWAEPAAALLFLAWLARETWEAFEEAREESGGEGVPAETGEGEAGREDR